MRTVTRPCLILEWLPFVHFNTELCSEHNIENTKGINKKLGGLIDLIDLKCNA